MSDDNDEFQQTVAGQFSDMERSMGREAYEARVKAEEASTENVMSAVRHNDALTTLLLARAQRVNKTVDIMGGFAFLIALGAILVFVMFCVHLFKLWVL